MNGHRGEDDKGGGYGFSQHHQEQEQEQQERQERQYREMVEMDIHRHNQRHSQYLEEQQYHTQLQQDQSLYQQPFSPAAAQTYFPGGAPAQHSDDYAGQEQDDQGHRRPSPPGRSITDHQQQQYQQQRNDKDESVITYSPYSPQQERDWPMSPPSNRTSQYFLDGVSGDSRSATPTLGGTPGGRHPNTSSVDFRASSLMNQSHQSLAALLPGGPPGAIPASASASSKDLSGATLLGAGDSNIQQLHERDDAEIWGGWKRYLFKLTPFLTLLNTGLYLVYLALRIACVIWAQQRQHSTYAAAWIFIAVEVAVAIPSMMHNFWTMWCLKRRHRPRLRLMGAEAPTVDVFVTCCGEDDEVVMDTVRAACDIDYPMDRFRVIVLDDGKSATLEAQVDALANMKCPNLYYMARVKVPGVPHHFKAGNLNYGLDEVHRLPGGAGQFMAALDADMIPERDWLRAILPHLLVDPKMALACPPQLFYNTPASDPLAQSLDFFVHVIEPIKDSLGVAWCTGSGYVVRREALDQIGNFPLGSLAEDVATSTLMLGKGWKTAYVHEPLQFGTVPEDYGGHLKQRTRWAIGTVDTSFKLNFCLWGDKVQGMTFAQRFSGFLYATLSLYTILLTVSLFAVPIILLMGKPLVAYANDTQLRWLIRVCFASFICNRLCEFALFVPAGYHTGQRGSRYQLWMAPYIALCLIRSFVLPKWLGGQTQAFKPTGSLGSAINERDPKLKKNMLRRLWAILINYMALFHLSYVYMTLIAVVLTSYRVFYNDIDSTRDILVGLITHAFWPPLTFLFLCSSLWTPVAYAIDPPQMPEREELLDRDAKTGVAHPTVKSKKIAFGGQAAWFELEYTTTTLYTCLIFVASFLF